MDKVRFIGCEYYLPVILTWRVAEETPLDRELQSKELAQLMAKSYPQPVIFLGYVVTKPHASRRKSCYDWACIERLNVAFIAAPYEIMVADGRVKDIDKEDLDRW